MASPAGPATDLGGSVPSSDPAFLFRRRQQSFTPFYVPIIVYSSIFRGQRGGILALSVSLISYLGIIFLGYLGQIPGGGSELSYSRLLPQVSVNLVAFVSVAFLGIYLSERLRTAHEELGAARILQDNIIDSLRSGLLTLDLRGTITFFNRVGAEILGRDPEDTIGAPLTTILPGSVVSQILAEDFRTTHQALRLENWVETSAERRYLGVGCSPLLQHGKRIGYILSFQDLTEIKQREDEMQFREKMAAIGEMAAGLAHELRNPLGALSGSIQILQSELTLNQSHGRLLGIILRESERLNRTVEDFLAFARPGPASDQSVSLTSIVRETIDLLKHSPEFQPAHQTRITESKPLATCRGNPDQLRQVLWNVLQNGLRAMRDGGLLSVHLSRSGDYLLLQVNDQGTGMSEDQKKKLFQPFHSGFRKGSGLGMAIVYQIVRQHGGEIQVTSELGEGTRIDIRLPLVVT